MREKLEKRYGWEKNQNRYIKMCSSHLIQDNWTPCDGDYFYWPSVSTCCVWDKSSSSDIMGIIWLPTLIQWQEILDESAWEFFYNGYYFSEDFRNPGKEFIYLPEEICAMRYMKGKNIEWSPKNWDWRIK